MFIILLCYLLTFVPHFVSSFKGISFGIYLRRIRVCGTPDDRSQDHHQESYDFQNILQNIQMNDASVVEDFVYDSEMPENIKLALKEVEKDLPSELEVRLNIMGFTPFTVAGFILAGFMLLLNSIFGAGWGARLFDENLTSTSIIQEGVEQSYYGVGKVGEEKKITTIRLNQPENLMR